MRYVCPKCDKVIEADYVNSEIMQEVFAHEKTHKGQESNDING